MSTKIRRNILRCIIFEEAKGYLEGENSEPRNSYENESRRNCSWKKKKEGTKMVSISFANG